MAKKSTKYVIGTLLLAILVSGAFLITLGEKTRIKLDKDNAVFYVQETGRWVIAGKEYLKLYDGKKLIARDVSKIKLEQKQIEKTVYLIRTTPYKNGAEITDTYIFDGSLNDVELFPISHIIEVKNAESLVLQYEAKNLKYSGPTLLNVPSPQKFGRNMELRWDDSGFWNTLYKSGSLKIKYLIKSKRVSYEIRLFDPIPPDKIIPEEVKETIIMREINKIKFTNSFADVELERNLPDEVNVTDAFKIKKNKVSLDKTKCPECNVPATILFKNTGIENPAVFHDGKLFRDAILERVGHEDYLLHVPYWSEWTLNVSTFAGNFLNTSVINNNLSLDADSQIIYEFNVNITDNRTNSSCVLASTATLDTFHSQANIDNHSGWQGSERCIMGGCLSFDGDADRVSLGDFADVENNKNLTLTFWINPQQFTIYDGLFSKAPNVNNRLVIGFGGGATGTSSDFLISVGGENKEGYSYTSSTPTVLNKWLFVAVVINLSETDGNYTVKIYLNDTQQSTTASGVYPSALPNTAFSAFISDDAGGSDRKWKGTIDELKIWNRSLTTQEIRYIYGNESTGTRDPGQDNTSLIAHFSFDEISNRTLNEDVLKSFNGTLLNYTRPMWNKTSYYSDGAYVFDGLDDEVTVPGLEALEFTTNRSLTAWFFPLSGGKNSPGRIMVYAAGSNISSDLYFTNAGNLVCTLGSAEYLNYTASTNTPNVTFSSWHHAACIFNKTHVVLYVDGGLENWTSFEGNNPKGDINGRLVVGNVWNNSGGFHGALDEIKVFNRALGEWDVQDIFNNHPLNKFLSNGSYNTVVHNVNETLTPGYGNHWQAINITASSVKNISVYGRASDNCTSDLYNYSDADFPYIEGINVKNGTKIYQFNFTNLRGRCSRFKIKLDGNTNTSVSISNYTFIGNNVDCQNVTGTVTLDHDLFVYDEPPKGACFLISGNDATVDFNGYKVRGNNSGFGVRNNAYTNAILINPLITGFPIDYVVSDVAINQS